MTESQSTMQDNSPKTKKVSIQERSVLVGDAIFVNGHGVNLALLKQRFFAGGYQVQETAHFLLFSALDNLEDVAPLHADVIMPKPFSVDDVMNVIEPFMQHSSRKERCRRKMCFADGIQSTSQTV
jgi:hypothetical protein